MVYESMPSNRFMMLQIRSLITVWDIWETNAWAVKNQIETIVAEWMGDGCGHSRY